MKVQRPSVGRIVHFVQPGVESSAAHRAAIVTEVYEDGTGAAGLIQLAVFGSSGLMFEQCVQHDGECRPGTWHWPEQV